MFGRLMPHEGRFFELFNAHAGEIVKGGRELAAMMAAIGDLERRANAIETIEKRGDKITHDTIELLHKTFITPLDRDDIHRLITRMDDILDFIEDVAQRSYLYEIRDDDPRGATLAELCLACGGEGAGEAVRAARPRGQRAGRSLRRCIEINRLENEADHVMRAAWPGCSATSRTVRSSSSGRRSTRCSRR